MTTTTRQPHVLRERLLEELSDDARDAIARVVACAMPLSVYAVGGAVRDLILGRGVRDIDLAVDGDAIAIAQAALTDARLTTHVRFGTIATRVGTAEIDIATTRTETYATPGSLPTVVPARIEDDLRRRDFSVNALALRLSGQAKLLDPCGGLADIDARLMRVLHPRSFVDDPTRIYRALRYAARLGFEIEPTTGELVEAALPSVAAVSGARLRREIKLLLTEETADRGLGAADVAGALSAVHPALAWPSGAGSSLVTALESRIARLPLGFALLSSTASPDDAQGVAERLRLRRDEAGAVAAMPALHEAAAMLRRPNAKPSGVVQVLDRYPAASIAALVATFGDGVVAAVALRYLSEWRHVKPLLRGDELAALGVPEGPQIHKGLQLIRAARLDGWASDEGDERALALRFAKSIRDSKAVMTDIEMHTNGH